MKERARALCLDVRTLKQMQDQLALDVPAFRPYAMIDRDPHHCEVED